MSEANKNVFKSVGTFFLYVMIPIAILGYYFNAPFMNGISDTRTYYLYFLFLAGIFDACKDTLAFEFSTSRFSGLNPKFWDASISWKNKYVDGDVLKGRKKILGIIIPAIFTDGWHGFKALHTLFIILSVISFVSLSDKILINYIFAYGFYKWGFNLFYNVIFKKQTT